jgi:uncharacterized membrane protein YoaK (UPF0700 family)
MATNESALAPSQRMRIAYLLALVGGFLDAYTYFERGGVFANAQTGNIVKFGIALADGARDRYLFYLLPIMAFSCGLLASLAIEEYLNRREIRLVRRSALVAEMVLLAVVGFVPLGEEWDKLANCLVSFVAAMQYETFKSFHGEAIATTMSTGNLRKFVDNAFFGLLRNDPHNIELACMYLSVVCTFTLGAFLGTRACGLLGRGAISIAILGLGLAAVIITVLKRDRDRGN